MVTFIFPGEMASDVIVENITKFLHIYMHEYMLILEHEVLFFVSAIVVEF